MLSRAAIEAQKSTNLRAVALVISSQTEPSADGTCSVCSKYSENSCRQDFQAAHEEGEKLAQFYARLDQGVVHLKDPDPIQLKEAIEQISKPKDTQNYKSAELIAYIGHAVYRNEKLHAILGGCELFNLEDSLQELASDGRVVHGFLNCNRLSDQTINQSEKSHITNLLVINSACLGKASRSVGSTDFYISHLTKQIQNKSLSVPSAFTMFSGYGDMSATVTLSGSYQILVDQPPAETQAEIEEIKQNLEEVKLSRPKPIKESIPGFEWAYKLEPMTSSEITASNMQERDFMAMVPSDFLLKASNKALETGLLTQIQIRVKDSHLSAIGLQFSNGEQTINSPLFGDKRKVDKTIDMKERVEKITFTHGKNVTRLQMNDEVDLSASKQKQRTEPDHEKKVYLEEGSHVVGVYGKFTRDKYNIHHVKWFSFIVTQPNYKDFF